MSAIVRASAPADPPPSRSLSPARAVNVARHGQEFRPSPFCSLDQRATCLRFGRALGPVVAQEADVPRRQVQAVRCTSRHIVGSSPRSKERPCVDAFGPGRGN